MPFWIKLCVFAALAYFGLRPLIEYHMLARDHAQQVSAALAQQFDVTQARIEKWRTESPKYDVAFEKLSCKGPDYRAPSVKGTLLEDLVYITDSYRQRDRMGASVTVTPHARLDDYSWRRKWAARSMPRRIKPCDGCELDREYPFKIDQWKMDKPTEPFHWYDKHRATQDPAKKTGEFGPRSYRTDWPVHMLVVRSKARFETAFRYERGKYLASGWVKTSDTDLVGVNTHITYCAYSFPDLTLLARSTTTVKPPERSSDFPEHRFPELGEKQVGGQIYIPGQITDFLRSFSN